MNPIGDKPISFADDKVNYKNDIKEGYLKRHVVTVLIDKAMGANEVLKLEQDSGGFKWKIGETIVDIPEAKTGRWEAIKEGFKKIKHWVLSHVSTSYKNKFDSAAGKVAQAYVSIFEEKDKTYNTKFETMKKEAAEKIIQEETEKRVAAEKKILQDETQAIETEQKKFKEIEAPAQQKIDQMGVDLSSLNQELETVRELSKMHQEQREKSLNALKEFGKMDGQIYELKQEIKDLKLKRSDLNSSKEDLEKIQKEKIELSSQIGLKGDQILSLEKELLQRAPAQKQLEEATGEMLECRGKIQQLEGDIRLLSYELDFEKSSLELARAKSELVQEQSRMSTPPDPLKVQELEKTIQEKTSETDMLHKEVMVIKTLHSDIQVKATALEEAKNKVSEFTKLCDQYESQKDRSKDFNEANHSLIEFEEKVGMLKDEIGHLYKGLIGRPLSIRGKSMEFPPRLDIPDVLDDLPKKVIEMVPEDKVEAPKDPFRGIMEADERGNKLLVVYDQLDLDEKKLFAEVFEKVKDKPDSFSRANQIVEDFKHLDNHQKALYMQIFEAKGSRSLANQMMPLAKDFTAFFENCKLTSIEADSKDPMIWTVKLDNAEMLGLEKSVKIQHLIPSGFAILEGGPKTDEDEILFLLGLFEAGKITEKEFEHYGSLNAIEKSLYHKIVLSTGMNPMIADTVTLLLKGRLNKLEQDPSDRTLWTLSVKPGTAELHMENVKPAFVKVRVDSSIQLKLEPKGLTVTKNGPMYLAGKVFYKDIGNLKRAAINGEGELQVEATLVKNIDSVQKVIKGITNKDIDIGAALNKKAFSTEEIFKIYSNLKWS